jgi:dihydrofolate synthase/folylpolyglutamate synthase
MAIAQKGAPVDETVSGYEETLEWLYGLHAAKGMDFKLDRMVAALKVLGDPHRSFPAIHIAGTNGKGSVAATLHSILTRAGYRVGLYVSPHLIRFTERIRVGGEEIAPAAVVRLAAEVRAAAEDAGVEPTFFEFVTLMAFVHFARSDVDIGVIEVGLGGRLDATNVLDPLATVITTIGRDHTQFLGDSIPSIAAEKAGTVKHGRPVIVGDVDAEAGRIIENIAAERAAPVHRMGREYGWSWEDGFRFEGMGQSWRQLRLALYGHHQRDNAATALATLAVVGERFPVPEEAIRDGLATVDWPGRLQILSGEPKIILDGAHNVDGLLALCRELPLLAEGRAVQLLFAVMRDKEWKRMVDELAPLCASATTTEVLPPRCLEATVLAQCFEPHCPTTSHPRVAEAWREVYRKAMPKDVVLVTGSLFLVGAVSEILAEPVTISAAKRIEAALP